MIKVDMVVLFVVCMSLVAISCNVITTTVIKGDGILTSSEITVSEFERINIGGSAEVRYHASQDYRVILTADSNLFEYIEIASKNKTLNIGFKNRYSVNPTKLIVDVYSPVLNGINISGSGIFKNEDSIKTTNFNVNISGSGKIEGIFECESFSLKVSGNGRLIVTGNSNTVNIDISGSGQFNGLNFDVKDVTVRISGSGNADINVSDNLNVKISGSGRINYRGNPKVESKISGSGRINNLN